MEEKKIGGAKKRTKGRKKEGEALASFYQSTAPAPRLELVRVAESHSGWGSKGGRIVRASDLRQTSQKHAEPEPPRMVIPRAGS